MDESQRQTWTDDDQRIAHREGAAWYLWREILQPARYREHSPYIPTPLPPRPRARHVAPAADDEEPSPAPNVRSVTVYVVPRSSRRLRAWAVVVLVAGAMYVVVTVIRSMMGAT